MSKLSDALNTLRVFNNYELLRRFGTQQDVVIEYSRPAEGRMGWCDVCHTEVWSAFDNPKLPRSRKWSPHDRGVKEFLGNRSESLPAALAWASAEFGHEYVPSPFGGYIPKHVRYKAQASLTPPHNDGKP